MSQLPTPEEIEVSRESAQKIIDKVRETYEQEANNNLRQSWEIQRTISNYLVIGSGAGLAFIGTVFYSDESIARPTLLLWSGAFFLAGLSLSLISLWARSVAFGVHAVQQSEYIEKFEQSVRDTQYKFETGNMEQAEHAAPRIPSNHYWMFNLWEWMSVITVVAWVLGIIVLSQALLNDAQMPNNG